MCAAHRPPNACPPLNPKLTFLFNSSIGCDSSRYYQAQHRSRASSKGSQSAQPEALRTAVDNACPQHLTFPAWLVRQARKLVSTSPIATLRLLYLLCCSIAPIECPQLQSAAQAQVLAPVEKGVPGRGPYRDALQCMLSVLMNLTHNNGPGCAAILSADGLRTVICIIDAVLGPPEEEAIFVRIADRQSPSPSPLPSEPQHACAQWHDFLHKMHCTQCVYSSSQQGCHAVVMQCMAALDGQQTKQWQSGWRAGGGCWRAWTSRAQRWVC